MAHSQNGFVLLPPNTATTPTWSESLDKLLHHFQHRVTYIVLA